MKTLKNFVAVDWRAGKDRIYFFFKDDGRYSRFDIGDDATPDEYPVPANYENWHDFHKHVKNIRFGFTTKNISPNILSPDNDQLWLFYYDQGNRMVCLYDQDEDKVIVELPVYRSLWHDLAPYFDKIVAGTWWSSPLFGLRTYRFLMDDGQSLSINLGDPRAPVAQRVTVEPINDTTWPGLAPYKHRMITAAQNDRTFRDSYFYIFLTDNEYITYNIPENKVAYGPTKIDDDSWPGLLRD